MTWEERFFFGEEYGLPRLGQMQVEGRTRLFSGTGHVLGRGDASHNADESVYDLSFHESEEWEDDNMGTLPSDSDSTAMMSDSDPHCPWAVDQNGVVLPFGTHSEMQHSSGPVQPTPVL